MVADRRERCRWSRGPTAADERFTVLEAAGGEQALEVVTGHCPDLIILDLRMPGMDGFEVLDRLRANPETALIPVMGVTVDDLTAADRQRLNGPWWYQKQTIDAQELL